MEISDRIHVKITNKSILGIFLDEELIMRYNRYTKTLVSIKGELLTLNVDAMEEILEQISIVKDCPPMLNPGRVPPNQCFDGFKVGDRISLESPEGVVPYSFLTGYIRYVGAETLIFGSGLSEWSVYTTESHRIKHCPTK
jgi:hypothetical protein